jgi:hypothetical protein
VTLRPRPKPICTAIVALIAPIASAAGAQAAPAPPMTVSVHQVSGPRASYFQLRAGPGKEVRAGTLELRNRGGRRITVLLDPIDAVTASTFGSAYDVRGLSIHGPTRWTRLGTRRVELAPHGGAAVAVSVAAPGGASPGDYLSGIGVQALRPRQVKLRGNVAISSTERYAVGLEVRLPGPRHPLLRLTGAKVKFDPSGVAFSILGRNPGNVILQNVHGHALITRGSRVVARMPMGPGTFVTGTSIAYPIPAPHERPRQGQRYRVRAVVYYRGGVARLDTMVRFGRRDAKRQETFGGPKAPRHRRFPWALAVALALALAALGAALLLHKRRMRSPLRTLRGALEAARSSGQPLSLIRVSLPDGASSRGVASALRPRLRGADRLCRLDGQGFLVVALDTGIEAAAALASELKRQLDNDENGWHGATVDVQPTDGDASATELLERVMAGNGGARAAEPTR